MGVWKAVNGLITLLQPTIWLAILGVALCLTGVHIADTNQMDILLDRRIRRKRVKFGIFTAFFGIFIVILAVSKPIYGILVAETGRLTPTFNQLMGKD